MSKYSVGATWKGYALDGSGRAATITLSQRSDNFEVWHWSAVYEDGSHDQSWSDWAPSYHSAKDAIPFDCRMKRIV